MVQMHATLAFWAMRRHHAPILDTRSNESSTGVIVSKDPTCKNLLKKFGKLRLPAGYLTLIHVFYGIMRLVVQMFDEFVLVFSSVFAQCIPRRLVHLVFVPGYINRIKYGFGFRSDQMYAIHLIDLRLEQSDL